MRKSPESISLFGGVRLRILISSGAPSREMVTSILASPAQMQVTSTGQRESSRTCLKVIRVPFPLSAAVFPTESENATPGSATMAVSMVAQLKAAPSMAQVALIANPREWPLCGLSRGINPWRIHARTPAHIHPDGAANRKQDRDHLCPREGSEQEPIVLGAQELDHEPLYT